MRLNMMWSTDRDRDNAKVIRIETKFSLPGDEPWRLLGPDGAQLRRPGVPVAAGERTEHRGAQPRCAVMRDEVHRQI